MSIVLSQCFCVRCESRCIAKKSETSAEHLRRISKKPRLYSEKQDKETENIRKYSKNCSLFLQKLFLFACRLLILKV